MSLTATTSLKRSHDEVSKKVEMRNSILDMFTNACDDVYSDDDSSTELLTDSEIEDEQETLVAKVLVKAAFERKIPEDKLRRLVQMERAPKKPRVDIGTPATDRRLPMVESAPIISLALAPLPQEAVKPETLLREKLEKAGYFFKTHTSASLTSFFQPFTEEAIQAYDMELVKAVRQENVERLRELRESGKPMHCGNRFGESICHMASRRGAVDVVKFLIVESKASPKVCCDYGRNPLHDACWSGEVNFGVIDVLLDACPDLLYITDSRGFTPLSYVTKAHWKQWKVYLDNKNVDTLLPRELK